MKKYQVVCTILGFLVYGLIFIFPTLGDFNLFDWDEINFAESSREMLVSGDFFHVQINFEPFHEKPPLFFWLQVLSMKVFGINAFAARFPNALLGVFTPIILFMMGTKIKNSSFGILWSLVYLLGLLPSLYFRTGIIDPYFNLFIFTSIYFGYLHFSNEEVKNKIHLVLSGFFAGLALITKGPVAVLIISIVFIFFLFIRKLKIDIMSILVFFITILGCSLIWYGYEIWQSGPWFIIEFIKYQIELFSMPVAGHQQPFYYHVLVLLFGCFPFSFFALKIIFSSKTSPPFQALMRILFWVVLILFTIVSTKIVHYSSLAYFPLSYLATIEMQKLQFGKKLSMFFKTIFIAFAFLISTGLTMGIYALIAQPEFMYESIKDPYIQEIMKTPLDWNGFEYLIPLLILTGSILFIALSSKRLIQSIILYLVFLGMFFSFSSKLILPKIDFLLQGHLIQFYDSISLDKKYISTVGFKSYAHYFYAQTDQLTKTDHLKTKKIEILDTHFDVDSFHDLTKSQKNKYSSYVVNWMIDGNIDRPCYLVTKSNRKVNQLEQNKNLDIVYNKLGYKIFKRKIE
ncbi:MAG: glycosyltransferase family 39 protein [Bacteroidota bacterium]|nr:glycosyltransferase family 39 protein [Bacteroidota bacterium]